MAAAHDEEERLRSVALQNAQQILHARRRAEDTLRKQTEWLRVTLASIGDAVLSTDGEGRINFMNGVAESLTGWKQAEATDRPLPDVFCIVDEQSRQPVPNPAVRALAQGVIVGLANHTVLIAKDGSERPIDDSAAPIRDSNGEVVGCVLVFRDVTERRRAELAQLESERRFRLMADAAPVLIWISGPDSLCTWFNETWLKFVGRSMEQEIGHGWTENVHPDDTERRHETYATAFVHRRVFSIEYRLRNHDGDYRWVLDNGTPRYESEGFAGYIGSCIDITDHRQTEEKLARLADELRLVTDAVPALISYVDSEGRYRFNNKAYQEWFGRQRDDIHGKHLREVHGEAAFERVRPHFEAALAGKRLTFEGEVPSKDGGTRHIHAEYVPDIRDKGRVAGYYALINDVTERKRIEEHLRGSEMRLQKLASDLAEADRRKNEFLAMLAHELRNPLAPISNALRIMTSGNPEAIDAASAMMQRQIGHLSRLVDDLLDVSRITRGKVELRKEPIQLAAVVHNALETARPFADSMGHELTATLPPQPILVDGDPLRLAQALGNLLNNACKYTQDAGRVEVTVDSDATTALISVRDNGIGIAADQMPFIFDMFTQLDTSLERAHSGLGIGLTLVKELVQMHGGEVEARSAGPGRGSEFVIRLPLLAEQVNPMKTVQEAIPTDPVRAPSRRILIVDDNRDAAMSLAMLMELTSNETHTVFDGLEAVQAAASFRPEVVLLDIGMPKLNGYEAARRIREQPWGKDMTLVALTGWGHEEDREKSKAAGFDAHLVKPVDHVELTRLLAELRQ